MYSIQFSDWGLVLEFMGEIQLAVMQDWLDDVRQLTGGFTTSFSVIIDVRHAEPTEREVEALLLEGLTVLERVRMERVAVIIGEGDGIQWPRLQAVPGPPNRRLFVAGKGSDWLVAAHAWVQRGIDPENSRMTRRSKP